MLAGQGLDDHKDTIESQETADVGITESGAVVTVPTPGIVEQRERFVESEAIGNADLDTSLAKVDPSSIEMCQRRATVAVWALQAAASFTVVAGSRAISREVSRGAGCWRPPCCT